MRWILLIILAFSFYSCIQKQDSLSHLEFKEMPSRSIAQKEDNKDNKDTKIGEENSNFEELRAPDAEYLYNKMTYIFGTDQNITAPIFSNILARGDIFGGPCDYYDQLVNEDTFVYVGGSLPPNSFVVNKRSICNISVPLAPALGTISSLRQGYLISTCEYMTNKDLAIKYALLKAFPNNNTDLSAALTEAISVRFSKYNLKNIFHLFYPTGQFTDDVADNIVNIANSETTNINQWRMAILTICASPNWTVP